MKRLAACLLLASACVDTQDDLYQGEQTKSEDGKADSSALATFVRAEFSGKVVTDSSWNDTSTIQDQLLFTVGAFNGMKSVGRVDKAVLTNVKKTTAGGKTTITYDVSLPVAWGKGTPPAQIDIALPLDISSAGQDAFTTKYKDTCTDGADEPVDSGSMFYYFRPAGSRCKLTAADALLTKATLSPDPIQTTGKFPEYDKVWEDGTLNVVAIFGKFENGATSGDVGINGYNDFVKAMKTELGSHGLQTTQANANDTEMTATLADGKKIHVLALLTDNVDQGLQQPAFRKRYEDASTRADFIVYNGHAGLGTNIRSLASAGKWVAGQYVIVFMNGCDSFAYIDGSLNQAHKSINPDDTTGYKYIDIVTNAEPAFFASMAGATMAMFRGLESYDSPKTYEQIFKSVDSSQIVLVVGEQDNKFTPGASSGGTAQPWAGLNDKGTVKKGEAKSWVTPTLAAGTYQFDLTGTGDADLYVRVGSAPTTAKYDCRPYKNGSNESCSVTLAAPTTIGIMVNGYAATSTFAITGK